MYWTRTGSMVDVALWLLLAAVWGLGGWLLVSHAFRLRSSERLVSGLGLGMVAWIVLSNLLAPLLPLPLAYWGAAILIAVAGLVAWRLYPARLFLDREDLRAWPQLVALLVLAALFTLIGRGLSIFDDYLHIPLVSVMATGDIPPHFYLDPERPLAYHYGLQVMAASLVRLADFFPWSAWDTSKGLAIAFTLVLGWQWARRATRSQAAGYLGTILITFGGGARWLLLLLPPAILLWVSNGITLINTAADSAETLFTALSGVWNIEGGGPFPFPLAFHSGIFVPVMFVLGQSGGLPFMTVILLLLLAGRERAAAPASILFGLLLASLALSAEHLFVFLWIGIALAGLGAWVRLRRRKEPAPRSLLLTWGGALALSAILCLFQGGFLTVAAGNILLRLQGIDATVGAYDYFEFSPQWPPALVSGHLGRLSLLNPPQLLALLTELGPGLLLAPFATWYALRRGERRWLTAGLGIAALLSILVPVFFRYGVERSSTRLPATALWIWLLFGVPGLWFAFRRSKAWLRWAAALVFLATVFSGFVIFSIQMIAIPYPVLAYYIHPYDATLSQELWNKLPPGAQVFDPLPERSVALFGRAARAKQDFYNPWPEFSELRSHPDPGAIARAGFSYLYVERDWFLELEPEEQDALQQACVKKVAEVTPGDGNFRALLNVDACR